MTLIDRPQVDRPFALPPRELISTVLHLPAPPSVNRTRRVDISGLRLIDRWQKVCNKMLLAVPKMQRRGIKGAFELGILLDDKMVRSDADNVLKNLIDYLRHIEIIADDSPRYMRRIVVEWGCAKEGCQVTITELCQ